MEVGYRNINEVTVIDLSGSIKTNEDYDVFKQAIDEVVNRGSDKVLLNFNKVNFINSSGLGRLILAAKSIKKDDGQLKIAELSPDLKELFTFTRLDTKIPIFPSEQEAVNSFVLTDT